jgi:hypothetical protein
MEKGYFFKKIIINLIYQLCIMLEVKVLGFRFNLLVVLICFALGAVLGCTVICSCLHKATAKQKAKEGMEVLGSTLGYNMSSGVTGAWGEKKIPSRAQQLDTHQGPQVPLPPGQLFFFADNEFRPECCVPPFSSVSSADGCACVTKEQVDYINMRGGNRTGPSEF